MIAFALHNAVLFSLLALAMPKPRGFWSGVRNVVVALAAAPLIYFALVVVEVVTQPRAPVIGSASVRL